MEWLDRRAQELDEHELRAILNALAPAVATLPEIAPDADLIVEGNAATRELTRVLIGTAIPATGLPADGPVPAVVLSLVRVWARRGTDLRVLMQGYRGAQARFWEYWMADVSARIEDRALLVAVLKHSWQRVSAWHEAVWDQLEAVYLEERERWLRGAQARRGEMIRALLAGEAVDGEAAAVVLGYDLRGTHMALVLWAEGDGDNTDALTGLEAAARGLVHALGGGPALTLAAGSRALWAWISTTRAHRPRDWAEAAMGTLSAGVHAVAGRPAAGAEGFRSSHQDAQLARRLTAMAAHAAQLVCYEDVELACLIASDPEAMRRLVVQHLGELARRDLTAARLRETARVYLGSGDNAREAAGRLNLHKNTVHYRLGQIEELLGRPIAEHRLEVEVALMLTDVLGESVLPEER